MVVVAGPVSRVGLQPGVQVPRAQALCWGPSCLLPSLLEALRQGTDSAQGGAGSRVRVNFPASLCKPGRVSVSFPSVTSCLGTWGWRAAPSQGGGGDETGRGGSPGGALPRHPTRAGVVGRGRGWGWTSSLLTRVGTGGGRGLRCNGGQSKVLVGAQEESQGRGGGGEWRRLVREHRRAWPGWLGRHEQRGAGLLGLGGQRCVLGWGRGGGQACPGSRPQVREGYGGNRPECVLRPPAEKRSLLVKELQSLTVAQRGHMLKGMPLGLAEKRSLRSVPIGHPLPWPGWVVGEKAPPPKLAAGGEGAGSIPGPTAMLPPRPERRAGP